MYTNTFDQTCREINWTELSAQKQTLMRIKKSLSKCKTKKQIEGLIKLIDNLQEAATEVHGVSHSTVYPALDIVRLVYSTTTEKDLSEIS